MWNAPQVRAASPSSTSAARQSTSRAISAPYAMARPGTEAMSGSSYWPMSAVYVHGTAPFARIHATATEVSRPPEKAIPSRSPTGREVSTLDMIAIICIAVHDHAPRQSLQRLAGTIAGFSTERARLTALATRRAQRRSRLPGLLHPPAACLSRDLGWRLRPGGWDAVRFGPAGHWRVVRGDGGEV